MEKLLTCPVCGSGLLRIYHKVDDGVRCESCGYFNILKSWNTGEGAIWDKTLLRRIRILEEIAGLVMEAKHVKDDR